MWPRRMWRRHDVPLPARPRFRDRLGKARGLFSGYVGSVLSRAGIDDETWDDLEEALIRAERRCNATTAILDDLRCEVKAEGISLRPRRRRAWKAS